MRLWFPLFALTLLPALFLLLTLGCDSATQSPPPTQTVRDVASESAFAQLADAAGRRQWTEAYQWFRPALIERPDDPEALALIAKVAHHAGEGEASADLMAKACGLESYRNDEHIRQAVIAMLSVGRLYDSIDILEAVVKKRPDHHVFRRQLVDFYAMAERREKANPHRRALVRQRKFDLVLLLDLATDGPRELEEDSIDLLLTRNPKDLRPSLAKAKRSFDKRKDQIAGEILAKLTDQHPDFAPAHALAISALARSPNVDDVMAFATRTPVSVRNYARYWMALGNWANANDQYDMAVRCYWEATRQDANNSESWLRLRNSLQMLSQPLGKHSVATIQRVEQRAIELNRLDQQCRRFVSSNSNSQQLALGIAKTLRELGRLWECEAWAAIAMTLPQDKVETVNAVRESVIRTLRSDTPWQVTSDRSELALDLSRLPAPEVNRVEGSRSKWASRPSAMSTEAKLTETSLRLVNEADQRGINFFGFTDKDLDQPGFMLHHTLGCGGGTLDYDLDGWSDVYFAAAGGTPRLSDSERNGLFRNHRGRFLDTTLLAGVGDRGFAQGIAVGDVNQDGFPDLLVLNFGANLLYLNQGDGTFRDASEDWLGDDPPQAWSTSGAIVDFNQDGLSDLVTLNYCQGQDLTTHRCVSKAIDAAPSCSPMLFPGQSDQFAIGHPEGSFHHTDNVVASEPDIVGRGLGIVAGSLDDVDGIDVFVANDMTNNHFWSKSIDSAGTYHMDDFAMSRGLGGDAQAKAQGSMGIAQGDLDRDGRLDLFVTNFADESNVLHRYRGNQVWTDDTNRFALASDSFPLVAFGTQMIDLDHDGQLELLITNGHVQILSPQGLRADYAQPFQVFQFNPQGKCQSVASWMQGEYVQEKHVGRALWTIDADGDHKTDVLVTHQTEPVALLMNRSGDQHHWIEIHLVGTASDRDAVGAVVELQCGQHVTQKHLLSGDGYLCSNERILRFGLGDEPAQRCKVTVRWPSGEVEEHPPLRRNQRWLLTEGQPAFHLAP